MKLIPLALTVLLICLVTGVSFATAHSQPGDFLYPVKTTIDRQLRMLRSLARKRPYTTLPPVNKAEHAVAEEDLLALRQSLVGLEASITSTFAALPLPIRFSTVSGSELAAIEQAIGEIDAFIATNKPLLPLLPATTQTQIQSAYVAYEEGKNNFNSKKYTEANKSFHKAVQLMQNVVIDPSTIPNAQDQFSSTTIQLLQALTSSSQQ